MRARQTAGAVEQTTGAPLAEREDLEERNFGSLRGTPYSELEVDPFVPGYDPPGGEAWDDFHLRVARVWGEIVAHYQARYASATSTSPSTSTALISSTPHLAIVSHGLFLRALLEGVVLSDAQREEHGDAEGAISMPNTALSVVTPRVEGGAFRGVEIERLACTAHLGDQPALNTNSSLTQK